MKAVKVQSRKDPFVEKVKTKIWKEDPTKGHRYIADNVSCYGYDLQNLVSEGYSLTDMIYLLIRGELPNRHQRELLNAVSVILCNPGPRHPATRSVMEAAVSKTYSQHLLPIGLMVLGGENAAAAVEPIMRFMRLNRRKKHPDFAKDFLDEYTGAGNDKEIAPGFGPNYELREELYVNLAASIQQKFADKELSYLNWSLEFDNSLKNSNCSLKVTALAAAVFLDLGFHPRVGPGLFQLLSAPGLLAHGLEMINQPISAMPFVKDENYHHIGDES